MYLKIVYLIAITICFYGIIKSFKHYQKNRETRYLLLLSIFILLSTDLWLRAYGERLKQIFFDYGFIITIIPLGVFLLYDAIERKRLEEQKQKEKIRGFFERYVSPKVVKKILSEEKMKLQGQKQIVSVMFVDICGFTATSEKLVPEKVVSLLNNYFKLVTKVILKHDGTVDKFIGDCAMVLYNAPFRQEDHADRAVLSAIEIIEELSNARIIVNENNDHLQVSIGINTGDAIVGNVGTEKVVDYTAIGDTVNTAARLQGFAGRNEIVISEPVYDNLSRKAKAGLRFSKPLFINVKGKEKAIKIYKVEKKVCA